MLPPTLYGNLSFTSLYTYYGGCAGDIHYGLGVRLSLDQLEVIFVPELHIFLD